MSLGLDTLLSRVQRFATAGERSAADDVDEQLATALLLAEMARADRDVESSERSAIESLLTERFALEPTEARELMDKALAHDEHVVSLYKYVQSLNTKLDYRGRCHVIDMLWQVAWADGHLDKEEEYRLRKIAGLLYVSDADFIRAKLRVTEAGASQGSTG